MNLLSCLLVLCYSFIRQGTIIESKKDDLELRATEQLSSGMSILKNSSVLPTRKGFKIILGIPKSKIMLEKISNSQIRVGYDPKKLYTPEEKELHGNVEVLIDIEGGSIEKLTKVGLVENDHNETVLFLTCKPQIIN